MYAREGVTSVHEWLFICMLYVREGKGVHLRVLSSDYINVCTKTEWVGAYIGG